MVSETHLYPSQGFLPGHVGHLRTSHLGPAHHPQLLLDLEVVQVRHVEQEEEKMALVHRFARFVLVQPVERLKRIINSKFQRAQVQSMQSDEQ